MRIEHIVHQSRRDFTAVYICEHCGELERKNGYDDANFHQNVVPKMECPACGKTAGDSYEPRDTKYPEGMQV